MGGDRLLPSDVRQPSIQDTDEPRLPAEYVVRHRVVLAPIRPALVSPHAATNLALARPVALGFRCCLRRVEQAGAEHAKCRFPVLAQRSLRLNTDEKVGWQVPELDGVGGLVASLPTGARTANHGPLEIAFVDVDLDRFWNAENGYRHRGRVDAPVAFVGRDPLPSVPASLVV